MASKKAFSVVVAATQKGGIGLNGKMPWKSIPGDMKYFKQLTTKSSHGKINAVILGRVTWESIPKKFRPLPNRLNIVLTRNPEKKKELEKIEGVKVADSLPNAIALVNNGELSGTIDQVFVIGGGAVYKEAMLRADCQRVYVTNVFKDYKCDTSFPQIDHNRYTLDQVADIVIENEIPYQFVSYLRKEKESSDSSSPGPDSGGGVKRQRVEEKENTEELQYLELVKDIIHTGVKRGDRTGVGTVSRFGVQMRFNLRTHFPLLTTKRVFWRGVVEELLWLIRGCTDSKELSKKKVTIWDGNGSREFLDKGGHTDREVGDLGPVYGFQWRHYGAKYVDCHTDYTGLGVDQLADVIHRIKTNPNDRRILLNAWNPTDLPSMALPPCHVMCQFYVANGELSCQMYQRSCDLGLGVPFNIASYSLLTLMIAQVCGLKPGDFIHTLGDAHVYLNHVDPLKEQLERTPRAFPTVTLNKDITDIEKFTFEDVKLEGYKPMKSIKMKMAV